MNKYQREKVKRMKKLANLGISYSCQKRMIRKYNLEQIDKMIEQVTIIKKSGILEKISRTFRILGQVIISALKDYKKDNETLQYSERIKIRR